MIRTPRLIAATGIAAFALFGTTLVAAPAHAEPADLTDVKFLADEDPVEDATNELSIPAGIDVSLVLNGSETGEFSFTGCWALYSYNADGHLPAVGPETSALTTWTAGVAVDTAFPSIDLEPEIDTDYDLFVWEFPLGGTCDSWDFEDEENGAVRISLVSLQVAAADEPEAPVDPESMTLTGTPRLGETVTVTAKVAGSLVGQDFNLWACPDRTIYPDDNAAEGANGDCYGPIIQNRNGDTTQFVLGYDPERDGTDADDKAAAEAEWAEFCGKSFIVHDYPGGGHSNWMGPIDCTDAAELAETGADDVTSAIGIGGLVVMLLGGVLLVIRRNREAGIH